MQARHSGMKETGSPGTYSQVHVALDQVYDVQGLLGPVWTWQTGEIIHMIKCHMRLTVCPTVVSLSCAVLPDLLCPSAACHLPGICSDEQQLGTRGVHPMGAGLAKQAPRTPGTAASEGLAA